MCVLPLLLLIMMTLERYLNKLLNFSKRLFAFLACEKSGIFNIRFPLRTLHSLTSPSWFEEVKRGCGVGVVGGGGYNEGGGGNSFFNGTRTSK